MVAVGSAFDLFFLPMSFTPFHAHEKRLAALTHATNLKVTYYKHRLKFFIHNGAKVVQIDQTTKPFVTK